MNRLGLLGTVLTGILGATMSATSVVFFALAFAGYGPPSVFEIAQAIWVACGGVLLVIVSCSILNTTLREAHKP